MNLRDAMMRLSWGSPDWNGTCAMDPRVCRLYRCRCEYAASTTVGPAYSHLRLSEGRCGGERGSRTGSAPERPPAVGSASLLGEAGYFVLGEVENLGDKRGGHSGGAHSADLASKRLLAALPQAFLPPLGARLSELFLCVGKHFVRILFALKLVSFRVPKPTVGGRSRVAAGEAGETAEFGVLELDRAGLVDGIGQLGENGADRAVEAVGEEIPPESVVCVRLDLRKRWLSWCGVVFGCHDTIASALRTVGERVRSF